MSAVRWIRCIVADYQFVRQSRLAGNTVQLLADVAFAVIAGEHDPIVK